MSFREDHSQGHSLGSCFLRGMKKLEKAGIAEAETDAWILFSETTGLSRNEYYLRRDEVMDPAMEKLFSGQIEKRLSRIPVQYILGKAWCFGNTFYVNEDVLIPRLDTEILIDESSKRLLPGMRFLDLCTGSGCILVSLLLLRKAIGTGSDLSEKALRVAKINLEHYGLQAELVRSDLLRDIRGRFDLIVSNPPYIPTGEVERLDPEVRDHEPHFALDGGEDGMNFFRRIIRGAGEHLNRDGWLLMEIGYDEGDRVRRMLEENGYREIEIIRDFSGLDRVAAGRCPEKAGESE